MDTDPLKKITMEEWEEKLSNAKIKKEDMNKLVVDFLLSKKLHSVALQFLEESGTDSLDLETMEAWPIVTQKIRSGELKRAYDILVDSFNWLPPAFFLCVEQQNLIELIRKEKLEAVLEFAPEFAMSIEKNAPHLIKAVERTMALLVCPDIHPVKGLLDEKRVRMIADQVDNAILARLKCGRDPKICMLLNMLSKVQGDLDEQHIVHPRLNIPAAATQMT